MGRVFRLFGAGDVQHRKSPQRTPLEIKYHTTDADGVATYAVSSSHNGADTCILRVLAPTSPAPGVPHNFLYVLPVQADLGTVYGDGLKTLRGLGAHDRYNVTIVAPSFGIDPWYADNPKDPNLRHETFMARELTPWGSANLALSGNEQSWLIGFSKSGIGAAHLLMKHPDVFTIAACWDFPADMTSHKQFGSSSAHAYGTNANFQANYRLTPGFVDAHKTEFLSRNRIWIGAGEVFPTGVAYCDDLLTSAGIPHTTGTPLAIPHRWDSGWVPVALHSLSQQSAAIAATHATVQTEHD